MDKINWKFSKYTLSFEDPKLEEKFVSDFYLSQLSNLKMGLTIGVFIYLIFILLDYMLFKEVFNNLLFVRATFCTVSFGVLIYFNNFKQTPRSIKNSIALTVLLAGAGIAYMITLPGESIHLYYFPGMMIVMMFNSSMIRHRFIDAFKVQAALVTMFYASFYLRADFNLTNFVWISFMGIATFVVGNFNSYSIELFLRRDFLNQLNITHQTWDIMEKNEQLKQINDEKSDLFRWVVHDLRSPLTVIANYTKLIDKKTESAHKETQKILKSTEKMNEMVNNLLQSSALESGEMKMTMQEGDLSNLILSIVEENEILAKRKKIELNFDETISAVVPMDVSQTKVILENLITNAIKYTPTGLKVDIQIHLFDEKVCVEVIDQGPGVAEDEVGKLFQKFGRTSALPTGGESSSGLGLYIVKKLSLLMNGDVGYRRSESMGSVFWFELPLKNHHQKIKADDQAA